MLYFKYRTLLGVDSGVLYMNKLSKLFFELFDPRRSGHHRKLASNTRFRIEPANLDTTPL